MVGYHNKPLSYIILQQVPDRKSSELLSYSKVGITENRACAECSSETGAQAASGTQCETLSVL